MLFSMPKTPWPSSTKIARKQRPLRIPLMPDRAISGDLAATFIHALKFGEERFADEFAANLAEWLGNSNASPNTNVT